jgi:superfamily II RNA helicase
MHRSYNYRRKKTVSRTDDRSFSPAIDPRLKKVFARIGVPEKTPFIPDPFQLAAIEAIAASDCLVTAPTGAGKTWIAAQAIARILSNGGSAWYACPLKALSNAKYAEFSSRFRAEGVGILTGDRKENPDAPVIVGTTEILRNQLYDAMHRGKSFDTDLVVMDEAHFLGDEDRGVVWEEIMIYLPPRIPLLLLSATIGNAERIAAWLTAIRGRRCVVVKETRRPVPLYPLFLHPAGMLMPLAAPTRRGGPSRLDGRVSEFVAKKRSRYAVPDRPGFGRILQLLRKHDLLPAIFFLKSRADCDRALDTCRGPIALDQDRRQRIRAVIDTFVAQSPHMAGHKHLWHLEQLAVGSHHSGQLPFWKLALERLMSEGLLDAVFATSTVSAGVNFPARTIGFLNSDRFNGTRFVALDPTELHQMTGRAGRRGMDHIGFALVIPGRFMDIRLIHRLLGSAPSDIESQIKINFSMVLNLLLSHSPDQIDDLLRRSFAAFCSNLTRGAKTAGSRSQSALWPNFLRHLEFLQQKGYVNSEDELTPEGLWASRLRVDQPLLIAEGFRRGVFPKTDPALLAAIIAVFVNEKETDERIDKRYLTNALLKSYKRMAGAILPFTKEMEANGFDAKPLYMRPAAAMCAWAGGHTWERAVEIAEIDEGDLSSMVLRTADNLRHIRALVEVFPDAADTAARAIELILRPPVVVP